MRYDELLEQLLTPDQLDEVRMGQSDLNRFINSPEAQGIRVGFEAELCFSNLSDGGGEIDYDADPEYERTDESVRDFEDIFNFFYDGDTNSRREAQELIEQLTQDYHEWADEQIEDEWSNDLENVIRDYILENNNSLDDLIREVLEESLDGEQVELAIELGKRGGPDRVDPDQQSLFPESDVSLDELYSEYLSAKDQAKQMLEDQVQDSIRSQDRDYNQAYEQYVEEKREDGDYTERDFLLERDLDTMWDVYQEYDRYVSWPYLEYPEVESGQFNDNGARQLARSLGNTFDMPVKTGGYHGVSRTTSAGEFKQQWIIEADGSLEPDDSDDMPAEIVSPPFPIKQALEEIIPKFYQWAADEDAYSNDSTGLHVGVSLPIRKGSVDYVKLALFLGDQNVLANFGRDSNHYCRSALQKIESDIRSNPDRALGTFDLLKKGLIELAQNQLKQTGGHGKYTSINLKGNYIEFRSMGGSDYIQNQKLVIDTIKRYAYAMYIASEPSLNREEYYKKLYKLLSSNLPSRSIDVISKFAEYSSGKLPRSALASFIRQAQRSRGAEREAAKQKLDTTTNGKWVYKVTLPGAGRIFHVYAKTDDEAMTRALDSLQITDSNERETMRRLLRLEKVRPEETGTSSPHATRYAADRDVN